MTLVSTVKGMEHKTVRIYPSGQRVTSYSYSNTAVFTQRSKTVSLTPKFVPGQFNIKPYMVSQFQIDATPDSVGGTTHLDDGSTQDHTWSFKGGCQDYAVNAIDKSVPSYDSILDLMRQEAYAKVDGIVWDVGVDLAELRETAGLLGSLVQGPRGLAALTHDVFDFAKKVGITDARDLKRRADVVKRTAKKLPQEVANMWLLYRYGLMPTLFSVQDLLDLLKKKLQKASNAIHTKRRRRTLTVKRRVPSNGTLEPWSIDYETESQLEAIVYYRRTLDQTTQELLGLTPANVPSILWEVTKLSFVWDWFLHIGSFIDALKPKVGVNILGYSTGVSHRQNHALRHVCPMYDQVSRSYIYATTKPCYYHGKTYVRSIVDGPKPLPVFTALDEMKLIRYLDAAALALKPVMNMIKKSR